MHKLTAITFSSAFLAQTIAVKADTKYEESPYVQCLQDKILAAEPHQTVGELRQNCQDLTQSADDRTDTIAEEIELSEAAVAKNPFTLLQHRSNYILPIAYNSRTQQAGIGGLREDAQNIDSTEFKFRLSFKTLAWNNVLGSDAKLYTAYSNTSWWQAYNQQESRPFRETNHEPETFLEVPTNIKLGSWELDHLVLGLVHTSNGRSGEFSRNWNRIYAELVASNKNNILRFKPWVSVSNMDDNPDIEEFAGRAEASGTHFLGEHLLNWQVRHSLDKNNRGSAELDWSYPLKNRQDLRLFVQYFDGYGESLVDYNRKSRRLGFGFKLGN